MKKTLLAALLSTTTFSSFAYDVNTMTWDEIEAQAKRRRLSDFLCLVPTTWLEKSSSKALKQKLASRFVSEGTHDGNRNKLQAESRRDKGSMDVVALGPTSLEHVQTGKHATKLG